MVWWRGTTTSCWTRWPTSCAPRAGSTTSTTTNSGGQGSRVSPSALLYHLPCICCVTISIVIPPAMHLLCHHQHCYTTCHASVVYSLNKTRRQRDLLRVTHENQAILKRIQSKEPHYNHAQWVSNTHHLGETLYCMYSFTNISIYIPSYSWTSGRRTKAIWPTYPSTHTCGCRVRRQAPTTLLTPATVEAPAPSSPSPPPPTPNQTLSTCRQQLPRRSLL